MNLMIGVERYFLKILMVFGGKGNLMIGVIGYIMKILMVILMIEDEIEEIERIEIESGKRIEKNYEIRNNFLI